MKLLRELFDHLGSWDKAIAGYQTGEGNVRAGKNLSDGNITNDVYVQRVIDRAKTITLDNIKGSTSANTAAIPSDISVLAARNLVASLDKILVNAANTSTANVKDKREILQAQGISEIPLGANAFGKSYIESLQAQIKASKNPEFMPADSPETIGIQKNLARLKAELDTALSVFDIKPKTFGENLSGAVSAGLPVTAQNISGFNPKDLADLFKYDNLLEQLQNQSTKLNLSETDMSATLADINKNYSERADLIEKLKYSTRTYGDMLKGISDAGISFSEGNKFTLSTKTIEGLDKAATKIALITRLLNADNLSSSNRLDLDKMFGISVKAGGSLSDGQYKQLTGIREGLISGANSDIARGEQAGDPAKRQSFLNGLGGTQYDLPTVSKMDLSSGALGAAYDTLVRATNARATNILKAGEDEKDFNSRNVKLDEDILDAKTKLLSLTDDFLPDYAKLLKINARVPNLNMNMGEYGNLKATPNDMKSVDAALARLDEISLQLEKANFGLRGSDANNAAMARDPVAIEVLNGLRGLLSKSQYEPNRTASQLSQMGMPTSGADLAGLDIAKFESPELTAHIQQAIDASAKLSLGSIDGVEITQATRLKLNQLLKDTQAEVADAITAYSFDKNKAIREAGEKFSQTMGENLKSGMIDVLEGKMSLGAFKTKIIDTMTHNVISTFMDGMMSSLMAPKGMLDKLFKSIGGGQFDIGSMFGDKTKELADTAWTNGVSVFGAAVENFNSVVSAMSSGVGMPTGSDFGLKRDNSATIASPDISAAFGVTTPEMSIDPASVTNLATQFDGSGISAATTKGTDKVAAGVFGLTSTTALGFAGLGMALASMGGGGALSWVGLAVSAYAAYAGAKHATGDYISGAGTGTSDSIPAMLSNGEFVINAKATKDHYGLLNAINKGSIKKFSTGGLAGGLMHFAAGGLVDAPRQASDLGIKKQNSKSSQSVFNINITGDISSQTRSEIQKMIPMIATGVNMHNYEQGKR
jgi:hypothetical protein